MGTGKGNDKVDLSVIIPAYNEEDVIEKTLHVIYNYLKNKNINWEIIVVDDGSTDMTSEKVQQICDKIQGIRLISYKKNVGKGGAVRQGVLAANGRNILFSDADLSTPITELEKLLPWIEDYDIVMGSRRVKDSRIIRKQPFHRRISGKILHLLIRFVLFLPFSDTQCGFKLFKGKVAKQLFSQLVNNGFVFDVEIAYRAYRQGYKIKEIGVIWANDPTSTVRFFKDSVKFFVELLKIRFQK